MKFWDEGTRARRRQALLAGELAVELLAPLSLDDAAELAEVEDWPLSLEAEVEDWPLSLEAEDDELLLRKSVTYQPEPLSWKPAAVTCLA